MLNPKPGDRVPEGKGCSGSSRKKKKMEEPPIEIIDLDDDESHSFTTISTRGSTKRDAISVEEYSVERDIALALNASLSSQISVEDYDLQFLDSPPRNTPSVRQKKPFSQPSVTARGECSKSNSDSPPFVCEICVETKTRSDSFTLPGCSHAYCKECIIKYIESKLDEKETAISCPEPRCPGSLDPENYIRILPKQVFEGWGDALAERLVVGSMTIYCPYRDCSAPMVDEGGETVRESECVNCHRLFCAECRSPWHDGIECEEFQRLHEDEREREDILLKNLAGRSKWARCPNCRFYVEKISGCSSIHCRCGSTFSYDQQGQYPY